MKTRTLRRLEALEEEHRLREERERRSLDSAISDTWQIVLAWYLGDLKEQGEGELSDAYRRALGYPSEEEDCPWELRKNRIFEHVERYHDAYRRLFAKVGLDFDATPRSVLFDAFVRMVNELPDEHLNRLRSQFDLNWLRSQFESCAVASGPNLPRRVTADNFLLFAGKVIDGDKSER